MTHLQLLHIVCSLVAIRIEILLQIEFNQLMLPYKGLLLANGAGVHSFWDVLGDDADVLGDIVCHVTITKLVILDPAEPSQDRRHFKFFWLLLLLFVFIITLGG